MKTSFDSSLMIFSFVTGTVSLVTLEDNISPLGKCVERYRESLMINFTCARGIRKEKHVL